LIKDELHDREKIRMVCRWTNACMPYSYSSKSVMCVVDFEYTYLVIFFMIPFYSIARAPL
jgi:hypothetical protein